MNNDPCLWCGTVFVPRLTGGSQQRFCCRDCRHDFHTACRRWAEQELEAGRLPLSALRKGRQQRARCVQRNLGTARWGKGGQLVLLRRLRGGIFVRGRAAVTC